MKREIFRRHAVKCSNIPLSFGLLFYEQITEAPPLYMRSGAVVIYIYMYMYICAFARTQTFPRKLKIFERCTFIYLRARLRSGLRSYAVE